MLFGDEIPLGERSFEEAFSGEPPRGDGRFGLEGIVSDRLAEGLAVGNFIFKA